MDKLTKPLVGWRGYEVLSPGLLTSMNNLIVPGIKAEAFCSIGTRRVCEDCPGEDCSCGFYACDTLNNLVLANYEYQSFIGEVYMWGRTALYSKGMRARYCYPKRLWATNHKAILFMEEVERAYGIPVRPVLELEEYAAALAAKPQSIHSWKRPKTKSELLITLGDPDVSSDERIYAGVTLRARLASKKTNGKKSLVRLEERYRQTRRELENNENSLQYIKTTLESIRKIR